MANIISFSSLSRSEFDKIKKNFHCSHKQLEEHIKQYAFTHQKESNFGFKIQVKGNNTVADVLRIT